MWCRPRAECGLSLIHISWLPNGPVSEPVMLPVAGKKAPLSGFAATPLRKTVTVLPGLAGLPQPFSEPSLFSATSEAKPLNVTGTQFGGGTLVSTNRDGLLSATANRDVYKRQLQFQGSSRSICGLTREHGRPTMSISPLRNRASRFTGCTSGTSA